MKPHKLDDSHVEQFQQRMNHWQQRLNMLDWRIESDPGKASKGAMADVMIDSGSKLAVYRVGRNWGNTEPNMHNIDATALHESLHIFLRPLIEAAMSRDEQLIGQIEHSLITVLEKVIPNA